MPEITANGIRIHYQRVGRGTTPVVMLHGLMIDDLSSLYFTTAPALADVADVILYDLRGHGRSEQPPDGYGLDDAVADLIGVLDALDLTEPVYILGNSVGGTIALGVAMAHPERVAGLMLLEAHVADGGWGDVMSGDVDLASQGMGEEDLQEWLGARGGRKLRQLVKKARQLATETTIVEDLRGAEAMTPERLATVTCPTLAIYGEYSDVLDRAYEVQAALPACELDLFLDCSHSVLVEATTSLRSTLADWFGRAVRGEAGVSEVRKVDVGADEGSGEEHRDLVAGYKTELHRRHLLQALADSKPPRPESPAAADGVTATAAESPPSPAAAATTEEPRRFLFVVPPLTGHVNPTVSVGRELTRRGHEVAWCGHAEVIGPLLAEGSRLFDAGAVPTDLIAAMEDEGRGKRGVAALKFLWEGFLLPLARSMVPAVRRAVEEFGPDVVVVDQQAIAGAVVAAGAGVPWVTSATTSAELTDPLAATPKVDAWVRDQLLAIQLEHGVAPEVARALDPRFSPDLVLAFTTEALTGPLDGLAAPCAFVGPSFAERGDPTPFDWEWLDPDRPLVLVSLGTLNAVDGERFFGVAVEALRNLPVQAVVVAPPGMIDDPPANVLVAARVPQLDLLARTAVVVSHAGHNTTCEALAHGIPLVVAPIRDDQPIVADQVVTAGAGVRIKFGRVDAGGFREAVTTALHDAALRAAAGRIRDSFAAAGGPVAAVDRLESVLAATSPRTRLIAEVVG